MTIWQRIVSKPRTVAARGWLFQIHLYTGLVVALYAIVIGVTGSALIFAPEMRDWEARQFLSVSGSGPHVAPEQAIASIQAWRPGSRVTLLSLSYEETATFRATVQSGARRSSVYVNPFNGAIVGERLPKQNFLSWLDDVHINLLSGKTGRLVNGVFSGLLVVLCLTGMVVWWPGAALWVRAISVRWSARWKRVNYDLHSAIGFFSVAFLLMFSVSGVYFVWPQQSKAIISALSPVRSSAVPPIPVRSAAAELPLSRLLEIASKAVPGSWLELVIFPSKPGRTVRVALMSGGPRDYWTISNVDLDPVTGQIIRLQDASKRTAGEGFIEWLNVLHFGNFGWVVKIIWVLAGLTPAILAITGALMWWNRTAGKKVSRWLRPVPTQQQPEPERVHL